MIFNTIESLPSQGVSHDLDVVKKVFVRYGQVQYVRNQEYHILSICVETLRKLPKQRFNQAKKLPSTFITIWMKYSTLYQARDWRLSGRMNLSVHLQR
jgi:hypothetical protein